MATTEHPGGIIVDPHNLIAFEDYPFSNGDWLGDGFHGITNPAHEGYGGDGVIWSTVAAMKTEDRGDDGRVVISKVIFNLKLFLFITKCIHFLL